MAGWSRCFIAGACALSLATPISANAAPDVPVQRPKTLVPAPTEPAPPIVETPAGDDTAVETPSEVVEPAAEPASEPEIDPAIAVGELPRSYIVGFVGEFDDTGQAVAEAEVLVQCSCLDAPRRVTTDADGNFEVRDLPAGEYTLTVDLGAGPAKATVVLAAGARQRVSLHPGVIAGGDLDDDAQRRTRRAQVMIAGGAIAAVTGALLLVGALVENAKAPCKFGLKECANAPRPDLAKGLGVGGAFLLAGGGALIGVGAHRLRKLRLGMQADARSAGVMLSGRF